MTLGCTRHFRHAFRQTFWIDASSVLCNTDKLNSLPWKVGHGALIASGCFASISPVAHNLQQRLNIGFSRGSLGWLKFHAWQVDCDGCPHRPPLMRRWASQGRGQATRLGESRPEHLRHPPGDGGTLLRPLVEGHAGAKHPPRQAVPQLPPGLCLGGGGAPGGASVPRPSPRTSAESRATTSSGRGHGKHYGRLSRVDNTTGAEGG